jgi:ferredoxin
MDTPRRICQLSRKWLYFSSYFQLPRKGKDVMPHVIDEKCIVCGACVPFCPEGAISEGHPIYVIDPQQCNDCGECILACSVGEISKMPEE